MPVETAADRLVFLNVDEFAVSATWTSAGGATALPLIFDEAFRLLDAGLFEAGAEGSSPQVLCRSADVPSDAAHGNTLAIGATNWRVVEIQPDGTGMTSVRLQKAA